MSQPSMSRREFEQAVQAFGSHLAQWPQARRAQAERALREQPEWQVLLSSEADLDNWLDTLPEPPPPSPQLHAALLDQLEYSRPRRWTQRWNDMWSALGGWSMLGPALAAGVLLGAGLSWLPPTTSAAEEVDVLSAGLFDDSYADFQP